jgi:murein DD-endopeptidase MepM/ murein hydrolase activator NlpD
MTHLRFGLIGTALLALAGCADGPLGPLDWDLRGGNALDTSGAALQATANRPAPDARGVISYPGYQVAVARAGDTVATVAQRVGTDAGALARYNALEPNAPLRDGEVLALPARVAEPAPVAVAGSPRVIGGSGNIDVTAVATTALDRVAPAQPAPAAAAAPAPAPAAGPEPRQHTVARGETAFSIARTYNVSAQALAEWNGLGAEMAVREGQRLMIPTAAAVAAPAAAAPAVVPPASGQRSPTPLPPSASEPLPDEDPQPTTATPENAPDSPDLGETRTAASAAQMAMPADGSIIRGYAPGRNEGIDIGAPAGSPVRAAAAGTVAAITQDTNAVPIVVIRHEGGLLTVYAGVDGITVARGDAVTRGQAIGKVRAGDPAFLHFEVRRGVESTDPMAFLQ